MTNLTHSQKAEKFAKLAGIHWHEIHKENEYFVCSCGRIWLQAAITAKEMFHTNPTFSHPEEVLEVMCKREDYWVFWDSLRTNATMIDIEYIIQQDALLDAAIEFLEGKK